MRSPFYHVFVPRTDVSDNCCHINVHKIVQSVYFYPATQFSSRVLAKKAVSMYNKHEFWEGKYT